MTTDRYMQEIREYIVNNCLFGDAGSLEDEDASLIQNGIIDSTGVLELIAFLEAKYDIEVDNEEVLPENLDSVNKIVRFLAGKLDNRPTGAF